MLTGSCFVSDSLLAASFSALTYAVVMSSVDDVAMLNALYFALFPVLNSSTRAMFAVNFKN